MKLLTDTRIHTFTLCIHWREDVGNLLRSERSSEPANTGASVRADPSAERRRRWRPTYDDDDDTERSRAKKDTRREATRSVHRMWSDVFIAQLKCERLIYLLFSCGFAVRVIRGWLAGWFGVRVAHRRRRWKSLWLRKWSGGGIEMGIFIGRWSSIVEI